MADEQGGAVFQEVLDLQVNTQGFAQQMAEVERIYKQSLENMPNLDKVSSVNITESIRQLNETVSQISKGAADVLVNLAQVTTESSNQMSTQMSQMASSVAQSLGQVTTALGQVRTAQQQTVQNGQGFAGFWQGLTSNIARTAGSMVRSLAVYKVFNEALHLTAEALLSPFKAVQDGYRYIEQFQQRASIVQAALLQSVSFSKNWGDNVRIAGEEADHLVKKIDDFATKLHVSSQAVQTGLTTFLEVGGANLTKSLDDAVGVSALITGALQTQHPQLQSRILISEIQKLIQGTAKDSGKLADSLGLSKDQLAQIVEHAKKYHDLYQELLVMAPGITERIKDANSRQLELVATLDLYKERWEALIAGPLFDRFTKILRDVLGWLDAHEVQMHNIGVQLGIMVDGAAEFAQKFITQNWDGLVDVFKLLAKAAAEIGAQFGFVLQTLITLAEIKQKLDNSPKSLINEKGIAESYQQTVDLNALKGKHDNGQLSDDQYLAQIKTVNDHYDSLRASEQKAQEQTKSWGEILSGAGQGFENVSRAVDRVEKQVDGLGKSNPNKSQGLVDYLRATDHNEPAWKPTHGIVPGSTKPDNSKLKAEMSEVQLLIEQTSESYRSLRDAVTDALNDQKINHRDAAKIVNDSIKDEIANIDQLIAKYQQQMKQSGAKKDTIAHDIAELTKRRNDLTFQAEEAANPFNRGAEREAAEVAKLKAEGQIKLLEDARKASQSFDQAKVGAGELTPLGAFDNQSERLRASYEEQIRLLKQEVNQFADGTKEKEQAINALNLAEQQYTEQSAQRIHQRIQLAQQERLEIEAYAVRMAQINIDRQKQVNEGRNTLTVGKPDPRDQEARQRGIIALEIQLTEAQLRNAAANLAEAQAKNKNSEATRKLAEEVKNLENQRIQQGVQAITAAGEGITNPAIRNQVQRNAANSQLKELQSHLDQLKAQVAALTQLLQHVQSGVGGAGAATAIQGQIDGLNGQIASTGGAKDVIKQAADQLTQGLSEFIQNFKDDILGRGFSDALKAAGQAAKDSGDSLHTLKQGADVAAAGLSAFAHIGSTIMNAINQYRQGQQQGGVLGGVGSLLQSGPVSDALSAIPVVGAIVKPLGEAFSFIGEMFTAEARRIAQAIEKAINKINQNYSDGAATLNETIIALKQERQDAITELSGKKGGSSELAKLLPQLDNEIAGLEQQVKQITWQFNNSLFALSQGGQALTQWVTTWQQINQQVDQYIKAGGSIAEANQFLNDQLQQQTLNLQNQLNQGQQQAIQDSLTLVNLQQQRIDLMKQERATEFGIITQDAIEKRTSAAVTTAISLQQQRNQYSQQLQDLNNQLSLTQQKVTLESQIFNLAQGKAALEAQSNQLTIDSLKQQLTNYEQIKTILQDIAGYQFTGGFNTSNPYIPGFSATGTGTTPPTSGPINGVNSGGSGAPTPKGGPLPPTVPVATHNYNITINGVNSEMIDGNRFARSLASEIEARYRTGRTQF